MVQFAMDESAIDRLCRLIGHQYTWLAASDITQVAQTIAAAIQSSDGQERLLSVAKCLESWALQTSATFLLELAGFGSKTTAVKIVREIAAIRFQQAKDSRQANLAEALPTDQTQQTLEIPVSPGNSVLRKIEEDAPPRYLETLERIEKSIAVLSQTFTGKLAATNSVSSTGQAVDQNIHAAIEKMENNLATSIKQGFGEMNWLKTTIDTERQLRRHVEAHGPLPEKSARKLDLFAPTFPEKDWEL